MQPLIYILLVFLICSICAAAGIGGGVIIKPLFDAISPYDSVTISMISLFAVLAMAVSGVVRHLRMKTVFDKGRALRIAIGAMLGGIAGQRLFDLFRGLFEDSTVKLIQNGLLFILLLLVLIHTLFFGKRKQEERKPAVYLEIAAVFFAGLFAAFVGIGGGPINICLVVVLYGISVKKAAVYSLIMIVFSQSAKLLTCAFDGTLFSVEASHWLLIFGVALAGILGGLVGSTMNRKLGGKTVARIYLAVLILIILINVYNIVSLLLP